MAEALDDYLARKGLRRRSSAPIRPTPRPGPFPQSFAQQRIWFVEQAVPGTSMYNMPECARIVGPLNPATVRAALEFVVGRHEAWRTTFTTQAGRPVQIVHEHLGPEVTFEHAADERHARVRMSELCDRTFDLTAGPLVRAHLIALGTQDHMLLLNVHHMVSDGWSTGLFVREFGEAYRALDAGAQPTLEVPRLQYGDYCAWQRQTFSGPAFDALVRDWAASVGPDQGYATLPPDRPRAPGADDSGDFTQFALDPPLTAALHVLACRRGVTLFVVLSLAFKLALSRLAGNPSVSLGVPVAGRDRRELEGIMGLFANTVVLHSDLSGDPTLTEALERERQAWIAAQTFQHVPFERLVERLNPQRSQAAHPFFQIMFILQNTPMPSVDLPGARIEFVATGTRSVKFDLVFELYETRDGLRGWLGYLTSLFETRTVERLLALFVDILVELPAGDDARRLSGLATLPAAASRIDNFLADF